MDNEPKPKQTKAGIALPQGMRVDLIKWLYKADDDSCICAVTLHDEMSGVRWTAEVPAPDSALCAEVENKAVEVAVLKALADMSGKIIDRVQR